MDGSPQHGYDWLLHGSITVSVAECVALFHAATEYIVRSLEQGPAPADADNRTLELRARLSKSLRKVLSVPVAVGSGKAGIRHKLHALVHSERIYSWSLGAAAAMVSRSFSWTGDLGCESSVTQCHVKLRKLFPWSTDKTDTASPPPQKDINMQATASNSNKNTHNKQNLKNNDTAEPESDGDHPAAEQGLAEEASQPAPRFQMVQEQAPTAQPKFDLIFGEQGGVLAKDLADEDVQAIHAGDAAADFRGAANDHTVIDMSGGMCSDVRCF